MPESTRSSPADDHLQIVVLAGGIGSRFWPASTPARPKQLLALTGDRPLIEETVDRACAIASRDRVRILTGSDLARAFRDNLPDLEDSAYLIEPQAKGTAPVLVWAAHELMKSDPEVVLVSLHADHRITPLEAFVGTVKAAAQIAFEQRMLLTIGAKPTHPETGYGYIGPGEALSAPPGVAASTVAAFTEKPDRETADLYIERGFLWNTGIFVWRADTFLEEVRARAPEIGDLIPLLDAGDVEGFFERAPTITVDVAVLERSPRIATVESTFEWDDVGSWEALARTHGQDEYGNVQLGPGAIVDGENNVVYSERGDVVLFGVEGLVVVSVAGTTLVTTRDRAPHLKRLLDRLPGEVLVGPETNE